MGTSRIIAPGESFERGEQWAVNHQVSSNFPAGVKHCLTHSLDQGGKKYKAYLSSFEWSVNTLLPAVAHFCAFILWIYLVCHIVHVRLLWQMLLFMNVRKISCLACFDWKSWWNPVGQSCPYCHIHDEFATLWFGTILKSSLVENLMSLFLL